MFSQAHTIQVTSTLSRNMYISICIFILRVCIHVYILYYYVFIDIVKRTRIYNIHIVRNTYVVLWKDAYSTYATATQFRFEKRVVRRFVWLTIAAQRIICLTLYFTIGQSLDFPL